MTEALSSRLRVYCSSTSSLWGWWRSSEIRRNNRYRQQIAQRGEQVAERLLRRHGYKILDRQVTAGGLFVWMVRRFPSIAARISSFRRQHTYIAEVKQVQASDLSKPARLANYWNIYVFPVRGVLLVDMVAARPRGQFWVRNP